MKMPSLKTLARSHGGRYFRQSGVNPADTREYWLIAETLQPVPGGAITRSAQIHDSWAMQRQYQAGVLDTFNRYSLIYVTKGRGWFRDDRHPEPLPVEAGDVICIFPGIAHAYGPEKGERWDEVNVEFCGVIFDAWTGPGLLDPAVPVRKLRPVEYWQRRFHEVVLPLARSGYESRLRDAGRLADLLAEMCDTWGSSQGDPDTLWAEQAKARLLNKIGTLDLIAEGLAFGLGEQAYRKKFKRLCGVTPTAFHARHLIEQACHRLIESDISVKGLAYESGFGTPFSFSRRFKQLTGCSPEEYRRKALK
jgi:AraC-like DNA-binding protein